MSEDVDKNPQPLSGDLVAAIERARQRAATPEMVAKLTSQAIRLQYSIHPSAEAASPLSDRWRWEARIAVAVVLALSIGLLAYRYKIQPHRWGRLPNHVTYSPVTRSSLVLVGYRRIDEDLDRAEAKVEQVSKALEVAALRREIQAALDEYRDWREKE